MTDAVHNGGLSVTGARKGCKTCGHMSHCGSSAYITVRDYACDGGGTREVKVCGHCNCEACSTKKEKVSKLVIPNNKKF